MEDIGKKISALRKKRRMLQSDLAAEVGVSAVAVSNWESGKAVPKASHIHKLAQVLKCRISYFFDAKVI